MFGAGKFLGNKYVQIWRHSATPTLRGGSSESLVLVYNNVLAKIGMKANSSNLMPNDATATLTMTGNEFVKNYIISIWDMSLVIYDEDYVIDTAENKAYKVDDVVAEPLWRDQIHKISLNCTVLGDARFLNFESNS